MVTGKNINTQFVLKRLETIVVQRFCIIGVLRVHFRITFRIRQSYRPVVGCKVAENQNRVQPAPVNLFSDLSHQEFLLFRA